MKKIKFVLAFVLACALGASMLTACGGSNDKAEAKSYDLEAVFQGVVDKQENADNAEELKNICRLTENMDKIQGLFVGIDGIELAQMKYFAPPISGNPCEIMLIEVKNSSDVKAAQDVLQARIDSAINGGACDASAGAVWEKNAKIQTSGNYVAMIVLPDGYTIPENIFE